MIPERAAPSMQPSLKANSERHRKVDHGPFWQLDTDQWREWRAQRYLDHPRFS
jgi:hypothetical protein